MNTRVLFLMVFCLAAKPHFSSAQFSLTGKTKGMPDGTMLYLDNTLGKVVIDSARVENNCFAFNTVLPASPLQVILRAKDFGHYRFLWLENGPMTFDATATDFRNASVTGSGPEDLSQELQKRVAAMPLAERRQAEMRFVHDNPSSIVSAYILSVYSTTWGKQKTSELFDRLSAANRSSAYGKRIASYVALNKDPQIGDAYVDFAMPDQHGSQRKLSDVKARVILLEFWAAWCGPCRRENPNLVKTYERFKPDGFEIFAVSLDGDKEDWLTAIEKDQLKWNHVSDLKGSENEAGLIYGVSGIPDNFLIDRNGIIVGRNLRGEELNAKLAEILAKP